jgi:citrate synthase
MEGDGKRVHRGLADVYFDKTQITDIRGDQGLLIHRGYSIDELAVDPSYENVAYLLIEGDLPDAEQLRTFGTRLSAHRDLPPDIITLLERMTSRRPDVALRTIVSFLGGEGGDDEPEDWALIALMPSIVVAHHALRSGRPVPPPLPDADLASDFLSRLLQRPLTNLEQHIVNLDFVLHADHGANASTFAARVATGTETDVCGAVAAAIATFAGPRHGGAVAGVAKMLDRLGTPEEARTFAETYRPGGAPVMGFGHRVYRVEDPRARLFRQAANELADALGDRRLLETLEALVEGMSAYRRFGISPNVDLYAAVIYRLLGLPDDLSTAVFAVARSAGWIAQIREQRANNILIRPRLLYEGRSPSSTS